MEIIKGHLPAISWWFQVNIHLMADKGHWSLLKWCQEHSLKIFQNGLWDVIWPTLWHIKANWWELFTLHHTFDGQGIPTPRTSYKHIFGPVCKCWTGQVTEIRVTRDSSHSKVNILSDLVTWELFVTWLALCSLVTWLDLLGLQWLVCDLRVLKSRVRNGYSRKHLTLWLRIHSAIWHGSF